MPWGFKVSTLLSTRYYTQYGYYACTGGYGGWNYNVYTSENGGLVAVCGCGQVSRVG